MKKIHILLICLVFSVSVFAQQDWRKMSEDELKKSVPEKAPVIKENIETEFRTASGISDGKTEILGVVIITAGYEADGKYTHFLRIGTKIKVDKLSLKSGDYVFGYKRLNADSLRVTFYNAKNGKIVGSTTAQVERKKGAIYSLLIEPPIEKKGKIYIGRFSFAYNLD
jgi:hypothetical protein